MPTMPAPHTVVSFGRLVPAVGCHCWHQLPGTSCLSRGILRGLSALLLASPDLTVKTQLRGPGARRECCKQKGFFLARW